MSEVVNANNHCGLSSREINRERRKARQALLKQRSRDNQEEEEPDKKKFKKEEDIKMEDIEVTGNAENLPVPDLTGSWGPDVSLFSLTIYKSIVNISSLIFLILKY